MTATMNAHRGHYAFGDVARMEWIKMRSLRSTWWTLAVALVGAVGLAGAVGLRTKDVHGDLTNNVLSGIAPGLLVVGVLGVLMMTSEFSSGLIKASLTAAPDRRRLLAAKAAVFGAVGLVLGEITALVAFTVGTIAMHGRAPAPSLSDPTVVRAVLLGGLGYAFVGLLGMGIGAIVRNTPAAIGVLIGGVYIVATALGGVVKSLGAYVPVPIVADSLSVTQRLPHALSPWAGLGMLCLYVAVLLGIGGRMLTRRDA